MNLVGSGDFEGEPTSRLGGGGGRTIIPNVIGQVQPELTNLIPANYHKHSEKNIYIYTGMCCKSHSCTITCSIYMYMYM